MMSLTDVEMPSVAEEEAAEKEAAQENNVAATKAEELPGATLSLSPKSAAAISHKRNRQSSGSEWPELNSSSQVKLSSPGKLGLSLAESTGEYKGAKKFREEDSTMAPPKPVSLEPLKATSEQAPPKAKPLPIPVQEEESESDSDSMYDDLDDFATPTDMDDFLDDYGDDCEDALSTTSTRTTMSTGSVGSNTPSLVGENLESFSLTGEQDSIAASAPKIKGVSKLFSAPLVKNTEPPLKRSLFSHVPPSINFVHHNEVPETPLPAELRKNLRWKLSNITPSVVKRVVTNSGYRVMRKNVTDWGGTWGKHSKSQLFKAINANQKVNHFPGTFNIGRKDKLWKNYQKLLIEFGKTEFNFLPRTFCLPAETKHLRKVWEKRGVRAKWIVKPPAMARGNGIKVVNKWKDIPKSRPLIVQHYISKPHLINQTKYDLRIYVLVTSLCPLKIYLYEEGLVRFASNPYTADNASLGDVFMHLTNYSINKHSSSYVPNEDPEKREGQKWTLATLWQYFAEHGIDSKVVWDRIRDMVIKTIISAEHSMYPLSKSNLNSTYVSYELFGFDVLLDADLKPWLIEVNISPSLQSTSPLDLEVKSPLATEVFNIARFHVPNKIAKKSQEAILTKLNMDPSIPLCFDPRLYRMDPSKADRIKQNRVTATAANRNEYICAALERLTPDDVRHLIRAEDELAQCKHFQRIFPTQETFKYFKYFQQQKPPRYYNLLFDAWEYQYGECRAGAIDRLEGLCQDKIHLRVPSAAPPPKLDLSTLKAPTPNDVEETKKPEPTAASTASAPTAEDSKPPKASPAKRLGFVSKPMHVKPNYSGITGGSRKVAAGSKTPSPASTPLPTTPLSVAAQSSPEPMSLGGESSSSDGKSRSPSPENKLILDNRDETPSSSMTKETSKTEENKKTKTLDVDNLMNVTKAEPQL